MSITPSAWRRRGRNGYPMCNPEFSNNTHYMDGRNQADAEVKGVQEAKEHEAKAFDDCACICPWRTETETCKASQLACEVGNCAVLHFFSNYQRS